MKPARWEIALMVAALAFAAVLTGVKLSGAASGDFRIDEAHKISESAFFSLWCSGRSSDPAWWGNIVDRTNPPAGKYAYGLAITASGGSVPPLPTLAFYSRDGYIPPRHPPLLSNPYRPYLPAARFVSTLAMALLAAACAWCAARISSPLAAIVATGLLVTNYATQLVWATAVFDPLLALFSALLLLVSCSAASGTPSARRTVTHFALAALFGALAFQTRLNGALFFAVTLLLLLLLSFRQKRPLSESALGMVAAGILFVAVVLILNPYYWATPAAPPTAPFAPYVANAGSLLTPLDRFRLQVNDLRQLLVRVESTGETLRTVAQKTRYLFEIVFGDVPGLILFFGAAAGMMFMPLRWKERPLQWQLSLLWAVLALFVYVLWLPLAWPRYLAMTVLPLSLLAGVGFSELSGWIVTSLRERQ